jgi:hypothetical protein
MGGPGGLSLVWYWTHQLLASMDAATVDLPLPPPEASAVIVASGKMIAPEQLPR